MLYETSQACAFPCSVPQLNRREDVQLALHSAAWRSGASTAGWATKAPAMRSGYRILHQKITNDLETVERNPNQITKTLADMV
jgi:hypothetical protein